MTEITSVPLMGKIATITSATNPALVGLHGIIVMETKNSFVLKTEQSIKRVLKAHVKHITFDQEGLTVHGDNLHGRPEDRIKKKVPLKK